jgi:molybdopterin-synthase adenylyltransferase
MPLDDEQIERYSRQILLPEIGARGQERLIGSAAAIVAGGSLAHLCGLYLAGAGVGRLALVAADPAAGALETIAEDLTELNPDVRIERLAPAGLALPPLPPAPLPSFDVWIDAGGAALAAPHFVAAIAATGRPLLAAGVRGSQGWLARQGTGSDADACIVCISLHERDGGRAETGTAIAACAVGVVASLLAFEALAVLLDWPGRGSWLHYDGVDLTLKAEKVAAHPDCTACERGARPLL